jgi:iron complex outermembrane receptor protein
VVLSATIDAFGQGTGSPGASAYLKTLSLDELAKVQVTSVSRREERANEAAAAVHVITEEDIRRSGARSIPEALRLAPNLQVAQIDSKSWAISARGFSAPFANKLLVLIDGRTVYSPLFSGVFWDAQDTLLEDVARIEVISGPGATVWGANAVNGVINIITKSANETQGVMATAGGGSEERVLAGVRYGGKAGNSLFYRVYGKYFDRDDSVFADGSGGDDAWRSGQAGMRLDWKSGVKDAFTLQGDVDGGRADQVVDAETSRSGGNLLARWTRTFTDSERLQIQAYYDRTHQFVPGDFGDDLDTFDFDAQYSRDLGERHHWMAGAGYRFSHDSVENLPESIAFLPATLDRHLFSAFVQDEISFSADRVRLTLGSKVEHNDYTGFEVQPSGRLAWTIRRHAVWGAISRAVRTPSRFDRHLFFPANPPFIFAGGPNFDSEKLVAYELGWRVRPHNRLFVSVATFLNDYDDIRSLSLRPPFVTENNVEGRIYGAEFEATWQATDRWRLMAGSTLLEEDLHVKPGRVDRNSGRGETFDPKRQFQVRSSLNLPRAIEFDLWARYVGPLENLGRGFDSVPDYLTLDTRLGWSPIPNLDLAIVGQNLLDKEHVEFGSHLIQRSVYVKATWRF